jgi:Asp-tRNAAsn/Glu-tRNAGln amidotransferase A subunit and related amidases
MAVLTPSAPGEAPEGYASSGNYAFNMMWTLLHVPCVALPVGRSHRNLPLGVQLVGPRMGDARLLEIARSCAAVLDANAPRSLPQPVNPTAQPRFTTRTQHATL